jgi:hypothetical protein
MNQMARIRLGYVLNYYHRLFGIALHETRRRIGLLTITSVAFVLLNVLYARLFTKSGVTEGLEIGFASVGTLWVVVGAWFFIVIPPRIEQETQRKEETLQLMSQRHGIANEIRNLSVEARTQAHRSTDAEIQANSQDARIDATEFHQRALSIAGRAVEVLQRFEGKTGHASYVDQVAEINGAVRSAKRVTTDEAIEELHELANVFERQLLSNRYL